MGEPTGPSLDSTTHDRGDDQASGPLELKPEVDGAPEKRVSEITSALRSELRPYAQESEDQVSSATQRLHRWFTEPGYATGYGSQTGRGELIKEQDKLSRFLQEKAEYYKNNVTDISVDEAFEAAWPYTPHMDKVQDAQAIITAHRSDAAAALLLDRALDTMTPEGALQHFEQQLQELEASGRTKPDETNPSQGTFSRLTKEKLMASIDLAQTFIRLRDEELDKLAA